MNNWNSLSTSVILWFLYDIEYFVYNCVSLDVLVGKSLRFLLDMPYSDKPAGQVKIQTVSKKYSVMLHTKHLICFLLPNCFIL